ncbi:serine/threonine-protein kinase [Nonomuraea sp. NPDC049607]|uniref:serine/threonine-protein kinase n=1 Tax=Nonomuraea sp. NPDC049607 TaxID=3154732 RepID=UPI0034336D98
MTTPLRDDDPAQIGPYRIHARLGGGGMGQVFLGRSPGGRTVAVKIVRSDLAGDAGFRRRFADEVKAARKVGGFYTAPVVDADPEGNPPWLATAYIPGPTLHQAVADHGPLPMESVAVLGAGLAEGLDAIHAQNVVHRDLKPANVILTADGPRLIDFGIARALDATSHTRTATVLGTAAFMSPEQATVQTVGSAADVFSLGCVLAFAATGHSPFGEGPVHAVVYRVVHEEPNLSDLPTPLTTLVAACLAKDPAARPTPRALLDELAALAPHNPQRAGGAWLPDAVTEVVTLHATRVQPPGTPPPTPHAQSVGNAPAKARGWMVGWKGAAAGLVLLALAPTAVVLHDGGTDRFSAWVNRALTHLGVRELDAGDCVADIYGSLIKVPCDSADAEYRVIMKDPNVDSPRPDPSESCEDGNLAQDWDRAEATPTSNLCLLYIPGD